MNVSQYQWKLPGAAFRSRIVWLFVAALCLLGLVNCNVVSNLPVIDPDMPTWDETDNTKDLTATIKQNNGDLNEALRVTCDFSFATPRNQSAGFRTMVAERLSGQQFRCRFPAETRAAIRNNHILLFEWKVESTGSNGEPIPVAKSDVLRFQVGCGADASQFLRNLQNIVLPQFPGPMTFDQIAARGYAPTHFAFASTTTIQTPLGPQPAPPQMVQKIFRGMGVAFARAIDVPGTGGFVPSGPMRLDQPNLLLFAPSSTVNGDPTLAAPSATYTLIGWAYATNLVDFPITRPPGLGCFPLNEWFIHERGEHTSDGGFAPGEGIGGVRHARLWDIHLFARPGGTPTLGIFNETGGDVTPDGYTAPAESFFYPTFAQP